METVDDLADIIKNTCNDIQLYLSGSLENKDASSDIDRIISYIKNNYTDCNFSTQQVAEYSHMALPNLSSYFKAKTGQNLLDYITNLKIEKAKHLLTATNTPLKDICIEVGYYNVSSFIRRFKQVTGQTPANIEKLFKSMNKLGFSHDSGCDVSIHAALKGAKRFRLAPFSHYQYIFQFSSFKRIKASI